MSLQDDQAKERQKLRDRQYARQDRAYLEGKSQELAVQITDLEAQLARFSARLEALEFQLVLEGGYASQD